MELMTDEPSRVIGIVFTISIALVVLLVDIGQIPNDTEHRISIASDWSLVCVERARRSHLARLSEGMMIRLTYCPMLFDDDA